MHGSASFSDAVTGDICTSQQSPKQMQSNSATGSVRKANKGMIQARVYIYSIKRQEHGACFTSQCQAHWANTIGQPPNPPAINWLKPVTLVHWHAALDNLTTRISRYSSHAMNT